MSYLLFQFETNIILLYFLCKAWNQHTIRQKFLMYHTGFQLVLIIVWIQNKPTGVLYTISRNHNDKDKLS